MRSIYNKRNKLARVKSFSQRFINLTTAGLFFATTFAGASPLLFASTAHATGIGDVLINEFRSSESYGDDWIELYNPSNLDLNGWTVKDAANNSQTISASTTSSYVVVPFGNDLNQNGDTINLFDNSTTPQLVDTVTYGTATIPAPGQDKSTGRTSDGGTSWAIFSVPTKDAANAPGPVENTTTHTRFPNLQAAVSDNTTLISNTISIDPGTYTTTSQINITKQLTINATGVTLKPTASVSGSVMDIYADNVIINGLTIDGTNGTNLRGINVYEAANVNLNNISTKNNHKYGLVVNGSTVTADNLTTANNGWGGVDVDLGSGVTSPSIFTITGTSTQTEPVWDVYIDDTTKPVSVNVNSQYFSSPSGLPGRSHDMVYDLKPAIPGTAAQTSKVIQPSDLGTTSASDWYFYRDNNGNEAALTTPVAGQYDFTADPADSSKGSLHFNSSDLMNIVTNQYAGTKLSDIAAIGYDSYNTDNHNGDTYLEFNVSFDGSSNWQNRLVYIPANSNGAWQHNEGIQNGNGLWEWSKMITGQASAWPDGSTTAARSWNSILTAFPYAKIQDGLAGQLLVRSEHNTENYIDNVYLATSSSYVKYDFENAITPVENTRTHEKFTTIQAAIDDGDTINGDTLTAAAGTYNENINVTKSVTIDGAQAGNDARDRSGNESIVNGNFKISSDNVTIDGFTIDGTSGDTIKASAAQNDITIKNNIISNSASGDEGIQLETGKNYTIEDNYIHNTLGSGIEVASYNVSPIGGSNISIKDNTILNDDTNASHFTPSAIYLYGVKGVTISGNSIDTQLSGIALGSGGLPVQNVSVTNNAIKTQFHKFVFVSGVSVLDNSTDVAISSNDIEQTGSSSYSTGTYALVEVGIPGTASQPSSVTINNNKLALQTTNNNNYSGVYVYNTISSPVDATNNWWGNVSGPTDTVSSDGSLPATNPGGTGSAAVGAVKYDVWCTVADCSTNNSTPPSSPTNLYFTYGNNGQRYDSGDATNRAMSNGSLHFHYSLTGNDSEYSGVRAAYKYPGDSDYRGTHFTWPIENNPNSLYGFSAHGEGTYTYKIQVRSANGIWSDYSTPATIIYDKTAPTVTWTSPASGAYINTNHNLVVKGDFSDNLSGINRINLYVSNGDHYVYSQHNPTSGQPTYPGHRFAVTGLTVGSTNGSFTYTIPHSEFAALGINSGEKFTVTAVPFDQAGNGSTVRDNLVLNSDTTAPTGTATYIGTNVSHQINGIWYVNSLHNFKYTANLTGEANGSGLDRTSFVIFDLDSNGHRTGKFCGGWNSSGALTTLNGSLAQTINGLASDCGGLTDSHHNTYPWHDGLYEISHIVYDNAGNSSHFNTPTQKFVLDTEKPTADFTDPNNGNNNTYINTDHDITVKGTYTEHGLSGISRIQLYASKGGSYDYNNHVGYVTATLTKSNGHGTFTGTFTKAQLQSLGLSSGGQITFTAVPMDNANNGTTTRENLTLNVDNDKPSILFTNPTALNDSTYDYFNHLSDISIKGSDPTSHIVSTVVHIYNHDGSFSSAWCGAPQSGDTGTCDASSLVDGVYQVRTAATDEAGNTNYLTKDFTIDSTPPSAPSLVSPANGVFVNGNSITQSWNDGSGDIDHYVYESCNDSACNSRRWGNGVNGQGIYPGDQTSKTATNVSDAVYWWRVEAVNHAGNESGWSPIWKITVDNTPPLVTLNQITPIVSGAYTLSGTASDAGSGLRGNDGGTLTNRVRVTFWQLDSNGNRINTAGNNSSTKYTYFANVDTNGNWSYVANTKDGWFVDGSKYDIVIRANDMVGSHYPQSNTTEADGQFTVDNTAPSAPTATFTPNTDGTQSVALQASDNTGGSGLASIYYTTDGTDPATSATRTLYNGTFNINPSIAPNVTTIKAVFYDNAGNVSAPLSVSGPEITGETSLTPTTSSITLTWNTNEPSTSRVIYDMLSHATLGTGSNYGYAFSTPEDSTKVTTHTVTVNGLTPGTTYYFRLVSHGSPETVSTQITGLTLVTPSVVNNIGTTTPPVFHVNFAPVTTTPATNTTGTPAVLGAQTTTPAPTSSNSNNDQGHVKGDQTVKKEQVNNASTTNKNFLGLGWWWLLILAVILGFFWIIAGKRSKDDDKA